MSTDYIARLRFCGLRFFRWILVIDRYWEQGRSDAASEVITRIIARNVARRVSGFCCHWLAVFALRNALLIKYLATNCSIFDLLLFRNATRRFGIGHGSLFQNPTQNFWTQPNPTQPTKVFIRPNPTHHRHLVWHSRLYRKLYTTTVTRHRQVHSSQLEWKSEESGAVLINRQ